MPLTTPGVFYTDFMSRNSNSQKSGSAIGKGGSMARFALINNFLYTVGNNELSVFNLSNSNQPVFSDKVSVDWNVETIYPFKNKLFVGSTNGMYMYDVNPYSGNPAKVGEFTHARSCDPVIADDNFAYVTLHSGTPCLGYNNELDIVTIK